MHNVIDISNVIKSTSKSKKITIKELLAHCNINKGFMYDLEHKLTYPSCDKIAKIADYLDVSVDYLLGRTDNPNSHTAAPGPKILPIAALSGDEVNVGIDNKKLKDIEQTLIDEE